ncbi:MAG TPA: hypothetical protein VFE23_20800 [Usitatibacter sp.]|jgi:uncharacterized repeat protein (TIGR01451 family)|nr:hypothetical protein [Usitatibacter sp.]
MKQIYRGILALVLACGAAYAQDKQPLESTLEQHRVVKAGDGTEKLEPAAAVKPGDVIEYDAIYRNTGHAPLSGVTATLPIPSNTEFVAGSAKPSNAKASVDGRAFADMPLVRKVVRDGRSIEEQVPVREYRYLRWYPGELGGDKSVKFSARVRVLEK